MPNQQGPMHTIVLLAILNVKDGYRLLKLDLFPAPPLRQ